MHATMEAARDRSDRLEDEVTEKSTQITRLESEIKSKAIEIKNLSDQLQVSAEF